MRRFTRISAVAVTSALALTSLTACGGDSTSASGDKNDKVKIMVGGLDKVIYLPAMLTERLGYFKEEGFRSSSSPSPRASRPRRPWSPATSRAQSASTTTPSTFR